MASASAPWSIADCTSAARSSPGLSSTGSIPRFLASLASLKRSAFPPPERGLRKCRSLLGKHPSEPLTGCAQASRGSWSARSRSLEGTTRGGSIDPGSAAHAVARLPSRRSRRVNRLRKAWRSTGSRGRRAVDPSAGRLAARRLRDTSPRRKARKCLSPCWVPRWDRLSGHYGVSVRNRSAHLEQPSPPFWKRLCASAAGRARCAFGSRRDTRAPPRRRASPTVSGSASGPCSRLRPPEGPGRDSEASAPITPSAPPAPPSRRRRSRSRCRPVPMCRSGRRGSHWRL
jgi:hypothetical protein